MTGPGISWLDSLAVRGMTPGLDRIAALASRLGRPERRFPSVLVAGTNGKGSTAATLEAIALAAGIRTGLYTSPHLVRTTERLRIGGKEALPDRLDEALLAVRAAMEKGGPAADASAFEVLTAAAFRILAEETVELAVLEIGLGGRCDATNLAPAIVSVLTPIDVDHAAILGGTIAAIAREKAGIFKTERPAVSAPQPAEALGPIRDFAAAVRAPLRILDPAEIRAVGTSLSGTTVELDTPFGELRVTTPLAGRHQAVNTATAVLAAFALRESGFPVDREAVLRGIPQTRWPGRLDRRTVAGRIHLLDGCHNPHGAAAAAAFFDEAGLSGGFVLVLGVLADKDAAGIAAPLASRARAIVATAPSGDRALPAATLAEIVGGGPGGRPVRSEPSASGALDAAREIAAGLDPPGRAGATPIVVAGSLVLVGEVIRAIESGA